MPAQPLRRRQQVPGVLVGSAAPSRQGAAAQLVSNRKAGGYASMAEIEAQDFTVDPFPDEPTETTPDRKELQ